MEVERVGADLVGMGRVGVGWEVVDLGLEEVGCCMEHHSWNRNGRGQINGLLRC